MAVSYVHVINTQLVGQEFKQNTKKFNIINENEDKSKSSNNELDISLLKDASSVPQSSVVDPEKDINFSEGSDAVQARVGTATKYDWSCNEII